MAGHRAPQGSRAPRIPGAPRHGSADRPAPGAPTIRNAVVASAAAIGAVATGTFTAFLPTPGDGTATSADAATTLDTELAAQSALLADLPANATGMLAPVSLGPDALETAALDAAALGAAGTPVDGAVIVDDHFAQLDKAATLAAELAARLAEEQRVAAERAELDRLIAQGGVDAWIAEALDIMDLPQSLAPGVRQIIMAESNGNPRAINNWDSNARRGTPSQGLMQTIPSTFAHYVHPDLADRPITDPIANITAGVRYMIENYGMGTLQAGGRTNSSGGYIGY